MLLAEAANTHTLCIQHSYPPWRFSSRLGSCLPCSLEPKTENSIPDTISQEQRTITSLDLPFILSSCSSLLPLLLQKHTADLSSTFSFGPQDPQEGAQWPFHWITLFSLTLESFKNDKAEHQRRWQRKFKIFSCSESRIFMASKEKDKKTSSLGRITFLLVLFEESLTGYNYKINTFITFLKTKFQKLCT